MSDRADALGAALAELEATLHRHRDAVYAAVDDVAAESGDAEDEVLELQRVLRRRHKREVGSILEEFNNIHVAVAGAREALWDLDPVLLLKPLRAVIDAVCVRSDPADATDEA